MKRIILFSTLIFCFSLILSGCGNKIPIKPEYNVNEQAIADNINLLLNEVTYNDSTSTLKLKFKITNKRDDTITIVADNSFKLYDINKVQIPNIYTNTNNIVKKDESINYILEYNVSKKEIYEIYFYSGVVENNIKFNITSSDIIYETDTTTELES